MNTKKDALYVERIFLYGIHHKSIPVFKAFAGRFFTSHRTSSFKITASLNWFCSPLPFKERG